MTALPHANSETHEQVPPARFDLLFWFGAISLALLLLGGWLTSLGLGDWYYELTFPPFQPPAWVFTSVWTVVLTLLAIAAWRTARATHATKWIAFGLYGAQCVLNVGWSLLFFTLGRPDVALFELIVLNVTVALMVAAFGKVERRAGLLIVPYLVWLLFATAINGYIVTANSPTQGAATMTSASPEHEEFMGQAIEVARQNPQAPFGSVLVDRRVGKVVARGVNSSSANPTFHGEIAAINDYVQQGGNDWSELTLYTTAEPCCMCQGALLWAGVENVVFGISIADLKQLGWRQIDIPATEVVERSWSPDVQVVGGVRRDECLELFERVRRN